jgi:tRNA (guanine9-N1)-methyltransferase
VQLKGQRKGWKHFTFTSDPYPVNDKTVYLTTEGTEALTTLEPNTTYIIGGIVDRNRYKGLCYEKAASQGLRTARLPIDDYIKMSSRKVLTCNHVVEIMLKYLECKDWKTAFHQVIPERKLNEDTKLTKKQRRAAALERKRRAEAGEEVGEEAGDEHYDSHEDYSDHEGDDTETEESVVSGLPNTETEEGLKVPQTESSSKRKSDEVISQDDDAAATKRAKADVELGAIVSHPEESRAVTLKEK